MTLLIEIYHHHRLPKGNPELLRQHTRINRQAEAELARMQIAPPPASPSSPLQDLHALIARRNVPWKVRTEYLHQRYKGNSFKHWPLEPLQLLATLFPADERKTVFTGKTGYNLFKSLTAILLHLKQTEPA